MAPGYDDDDPSQTFLSKHLRRKGKWEPGVLKRAAKVMSATTRVKRKGFDAQPSYLRKTMRHPDNKDFEPGWRYQPIFRRLEIAERLRGEGTEFYREGNHADAVERYAMAAGLFHYIRKTAEPPDTGVDDLCIEIVTDDRGDDCPADAAESLEHVRNVRVACYLNIAQCFLRQAQPDYEEARRACDGALDLEPTSVKALYRRALANEESGGGLFLEAAARDATAAAELDPSDMAVQALRRRVRTEMRRQNGADQKMFRGFFARGAIGGGEQRLEEAAAAHDRTAAAQADGQDLQNSLDEACRLRQTYRAAGKEADEREMEVAIERLKERIAERKERDIDVFRPSVELTEAAKRFDIDLNDPEERKKVDRAMWQANTVQHGSQDGDGRSVKPGTVKNFEGNRNQGTWRDAIALAIVSFAFIWFFLLARMFHG